MIHKHLQIGSLFCMAAVLVVISACSKNNNDVMASKALQDKQPVTVLALGDSYTKGEGVPTSQSFPHLFKKKLENNSAYSIKKLTVIAETGWTTANLINGINAQNIKDTFNLVTLLIGVNNQYQNLSVQQYETEFLQLVQKAIGFAGNQKDKVVVLSIPDYGATPFGKGSAALIGKEIDKFNSVNKMVAELAGVKYIEITALSRLAANDETLTSSDGLHPSAKMYQMWVDKFYGDAIQILKNH